MEPVASSSPQAQEDNHQGPVIRDRRRIDPETGKVRRPAHVKIESEDEVYVPAEPAGTEPSPPPASGAAAAGSRTAEPGTGPAADPDPAEELARARARIEEHRSDLQRVQAEYVNYRRRVDRDREVAGRLAVAGLLESLLPVLDDIHLARQHGDLAEGPFVAIVDKLESTLARHGLERYGEPGEAFDPTVHEALIHTRAELAEGTTDTTVVQVMQPGYRAGDRVLRAARVAVADPQ